MASTGLHGPFELSVETIDAVLNNISPGAYALGPKRDGKFYVHRVGRADRDVRARLKDYVGHYAAFKVDYFPDARSAFEKECELFHDFNPRDNTYHPDSPDGLNLTCPRCPALD